MNTKLIKKFFGLFGFLALVSSNVQSQVLYTNKKLTECGMTGSIQNRLADCSHVYNEKAQAKGRESTEWQLLSLSSDGHQIWVEMNTGLAVTSHNGDGTDTQDQHTSRKGRSVYLEKAISGCEDQNAYTELKLGNEFSFRLPTKADAEFLIRARIADVFWSTPSNGLFRHTVRGGPDDEGANLLVLPSWVFFTLWTSEIAPQSKADKKKKKRRAYTMDRSSLSIAGPIDYTPGIYGTFTRQKVNFQAYRLFLCVGNIPAEDLPPR